MEKGSSKVLEMKICPWHPIQRQYIILFEVKITQPADVGMDKKTLGMIDKIFII